MCGAGGDNAAFPCLKLGCAMLASPVLAYEVNYQILNSPGPEIR